MIIKKIQKRAITLLEIMIVIFLIGLIGGVIGVNMKGSLDEGKAFKTRQAKEQLRDILLLEVARNDQISLQDVVKDPENYVDKSEMAKNPKSLIVDGWGEKFELSISKKQDIIIKSKKLDKYDEKQKKKRGIETSSEELEDEEY